jgi:hypothetical protein
MADDDRTMVVAMVDETYRIARDEGFYPCPVSYERVDADADVLGVYRTAPQSAITHYAPIERRFVDDGEWMGDDRFESLVGSRSADEEAVVFELDTLVALDTPVRDDDGGLRGAWFTTVDELERAETLSELAVDERLPSD